MTASMLPLSVVSCQTLSPSGPGPATQGATFCEIAQPIILDQKDVVTDKTATSIIRHDEKGEALCGWAAPSPEKSAKGT